MKILLMLAIVQSLNLVIFAWFNRVAGLRILVLRQQLTVYKRKSKKPMLVEWEPTAEGNVRTLNDTVDFYRFFDATPHAEFLYSCVRKTIEEDLPRETDFLARYDQFRARIESMVDMPDRTLELLFRFLRQNGGRLSKRAREGELAAMSDGEVASAEQAYADLFSDLSNRQE